MAALCLGGGEAKAVGIELSLAPAPFCGYIEANRGSLGVDFQ